MRTKKQITPLINQEELPEVMRHFSTATSKIKAIEAEIELAKAEILRNYEKKLATLNEQREEAFEKLQLYSEQHKTELYANRRSIELPHGLMGYRMGTPQVEKSKKVTWDGVIDQLRGIDPAFVRVKEEANKELIIASRTNEQVMGRLERIGLSVVQKETFFVEVKEEELVAN